MAVDKHYRLTAFGTLPGSEIFSFSLSMATGEQEGISTWFQGALEPNGTVWQDIAMDFRTFWRACPISDRAVLKGIKAAAIGTDGKYAAPPVERGYPTEPNGVPGLSFENHLPQQVSQCVTLHTTGDLGRVKGRFYVPMPAVAVQPDGLTSESVRDTFESAAATLVDNLNNQPGIDVLNLRVVVPSAGRHNSDGSVKIPPQNHLVTEVSVGRVLDTQRRRRNKLRELRGTPTAVAP